VAGWTPPPSDVARSPRRMTPWLARPINYDPSVNAAEQALVDAKKNALIEAFLWRDLHCTAVEDSKEAAVPARDAIHQPSEVSGPVRPEGHPTN